MAAPAVAVLLTLLCLCVYLLLLPGVADDDNDDYTSLPGPAPHRRRARAGRRYMPPEAETELQQLLRSGQRHGLPDLRTFRDALDRLPDAAAAASFDAAALGPLERYFGADGALGARERVAYLFAALDRSPRDGGVDHAELEQWLHRRAAERLEAVTRREMELHDADGDGAVTLHEYLGLHPDHDIEWSNTEHGKPGWWRQKFESADRGETATLDTVELNDFLHPEDSSEEKVRLWIINDKISEMDRDRDGRLGLEEFVGQAHRMMDLHGSTHAEQTFRELDVDMDNYLTVEEARPVIQGMVTGELSYARSHAKLLMKADDDGDGKLSLEEMVNHYMSFYNVVYMDDDHFDDDDDALHDELR